MSAGLFAEALKLLIFSLILILIAEAVLPGIVTNRINITYLFIAVILLLISAKKLAEVTSLETAEKKKNGKIMMPISVFLSLLLLIRSLIKFPLWEIIIIAISTALISYLVVKDLYGK
jgi:hypothetical protein